MEYKKKIVVILIFMLAVINLLCFASFAHGGKTNANGGHYDKSTGEYHYHHGYSAHSHYDMDGDGEIDCPYDFEDRTDHGNCGSSSGNSGYSDYDNYNNYDNADNTYINIKKVTIGEIVWIIIQIVLYSLVAVMCSCMLLMFVFAGTSTIVDLVARKLFKVEIDELTLNKVGWISVIIAIGIIIVLVSISVLKGNSIIQ